MAERVRPSLAIEAQNRRRSKRLAGGSMFGARPIGARGGAAL